MSMLQGLLKTIQNLNQLLDRGIIEPGDYAVNLLGASTLLDTDSDLANEVASAISPLAHDAVIEACADALRPDFQYRPPNIGGPGPGPERLAEMTAERTRRVQAWASSLLPLLRPS